MEIVQTRPIVGPRDPAHIIEAILMASNNLRDICRYCGNELHASTKILDALKEMPEWYKAADGDTDPALTGYLNGVIRVYHDADLEDGTCIIAFKGNILQGETGIYLVL